MAQQPLSPAAAWRARLRSDLMAARKARHPARMSALRCALAAIDNAQTPDAASTVWLNSTEALRRELTDTQIRGLLETEIAERLHAADTVRAHGEHMRAGTLRAEAEILGDLLVDPVEAL
ncbi:GatB/YqeY domain-containing protein [Mycolicibacterium mengxianglii]|uniref:GatB/YqeY domain-containing protein n=1 Tax=Mycolicibacterium mengxianglii TaxID=2736649 RepID=UPI0018D19052|nr:GatB/YqeY domain-containing protein [Mycolicibacterium mengxianglii]